MSFRYLTTRRHEDYWAAFDRSARTWAGQRRQSPLGRLSNAEHCSL